MESLINTFKQNKNLIEEAIKLDFKEWDYEFEFQYILDCIEENENNKLENLKEKQNIYYPKNIAVVGKIDPKVLMNLIIKCLTLDINITFYLKDKLLATNKAILDSLKNNKYKYVYVKNIDEFYKKQDEYDICLYLGNKKEYLNFTKRLNILSVYQNYGEIYIFLENKEFKSEMLNLEKYAYNNDIEIKYYISDFEKAITEINNIGPVNIFGIYSKDSENAYKIANEIYSENVYINIDLTKKYKFDFDLKKLIIKKKIVYK